MLQVALFYVNRITKRQGFCNNRNTNLADACAICYYVIGGMEGVIGMKRPRIGIVDDEAGVREALSALLSENEFEPVPMNSIAEFDALGTPPDLELVLIDLKLRGESGLSLAKKIRNTQDLPIVMLTGTGDETDKIIGLEIGADDYLLKPFNSRELIARIRAVLRRYNVSLNTRIEPSDSGAKICFGHLVVDREQRIVSTRDGNEISLTNAEYRLLDYFLKRPNQIIPRIDLLLEIGSDVSQYLDRTIDVLILRLRRKIEENPSKPAHLQTRRGKGYIFVTDIQSHSL